METKQKALPPASVALDRLARMKGYSRYLCRLMGPYLGQRILEVGCGTGAITQCLMERSSVVAIDKSEENLSDLKKRLSEGERLRVLRHDIEAEPLPPGVCPPPFTVVCMNVLEHIERDDRALKNIAAAMDENSTCVLFVPARKKWFSPIDEAVGHLRRYDKEDLRSLISASGLVTERLISINFLPAIGWWITFCLFRKRTFPGWAFFLAEELTPLFSGFDRLFQDLGLNLLAVCKKPSARHITA